MGNPWRTAFEQGCAQALNSLLAERGAQEMLAHVTSPFADALGSPNPLGILKTLSKHPRLLEQVDVPNEGGQSALWLAMGQEKVLEAGILLKTGANPNQRGLQGLLPSWFLAWQGQAALLQVLLTYGARLDDDRPGHPGVVELAIESRSRETFALVLEQAGVDAWAPTHKGRDLWQALGSLQNSWGGLLEQARKRQRARLLHQAWQVSFPAAGCPLALTARL